MGTSESRVIRFGVYALDVASGELRKSGTKIRIQEQPFQVLKALVERPGEVVTREELQQRLWPDGTYVDYEDGLATAVRKARNALGDSATNPRFVETLPKRGYRFIAAVDAGVVAGERPEDIAPPGQTEGATSQSVSRRYGLALALVALVCALGFLVLHGTRDSSGGLLDLSQYAETPLTNYRGLEGGPSLSPDGKLVAFAWTGESGENVDIYIKQVDSTADAPVRLTYDPDLDYSPTWSPDGQWIGFLRTEPGVPQGAEQRSKVMVMPALGGPARTVQERVNTFPTAWANLLSQLDWSPDGAYLVFPSSPNPAHKKAASLAAVPVEGGAIRWLTSPSYDYGAASPVFSPTGDRLAYIQRRSWASGHDIYMLDLRPDMTAVGAPRRLTSFARSVGNPVWTADGELLLFRGENGTGQAGIWAVEASGAETPRLVRPSTGLASIPLFNTLSIAYATSSGTNRVAFPLASGQEDIWEVDVEGPLAGKPRPLVDTNAVEGFGAVSPDGRRLAFVSSASGSREIWIAERDGSRAVQLTDLGDERLGMKGWSPDGSLIVFHGFTEGQADIYVVDPDTGKSRRLASSPYVEQHPSWSRSGEWIYYSSREAGGRTMRVSARTGEIETVAEFSSGFPEETWDGSELIYYSSGQMRQKLENGKLVGEPQALHPLWRVVAPGGLYYQEEGWLKFLDLEQRNSRDVFPLDDRFRIQTITADGKTLLMDRRTRDSDLRLLRVVGSKD